MLYVGIDVHQYTSSVCILDQQGNTQKQFTHRAHWTGLMARLEAEIHEPFCACFEASTAYGPIYEALRRIAERVVVAHPGQLRLIFRSKRKNDRVDAFKLAFLLRLGQIPEVHVPPAGVREWRQMIRFRYNLINERTRTKNRIRNLLRTQGIESPYKLWNRRGLEWLSRLELPGAMSALSRDMLLEQLQAQQARIKRVEGRLSAVAAVNPAVQLLMTIPGVGVRTAEAVVAWIDQPGRFAKPGTLASYFGLVPSQDASGGINRLGRITRQGPNVIRKLLVEAAWQAIRRSPEIRAHYERLVRGDPQRRKIAIVAVAHHLVRIMTALLKSGQPYAPAE